MQLWVIGNLNGAIDPPETLDTFEARRRGAEMASEQRDPGLTREEFFSEELTRGLRRPLPPERAKHSCSIPRARRPA